ncbi:hypothetical protein [Rhizobium tubonense]|uniref:Uncharacterized protein n=1 Tax=Rhizobium tubonense TaxID=484088 RepID=A0A2W4E6U0_9HYPH|nr:hypothetical protein [Rhizobium tubonense]PZM07570.1 hypothetical protein CPY51_31050 [Rhizobium tubonense]
MRDNMITIGSNIGIGLLSLLFNYQTLIAGILAVLAAIWTVRQMRASEKSADARHDQLVGLMLKRDQLIVDRAANPLLERLNLTLPKLLKTKEGFSESQDPTAYLRSNMEAIAQIGVESQLISNPFLADARPLFDGQLVHMLETISGRGASIGFQLYDLRKLAENAESAGQQVPDVAYEQCAIEVRSAINHLPSEVMEFIERLSLLRSEYSAK